MQNVNHRGLRSRSYIERQEPPLKAEDFSLIKRRQIACKAYNKSADCERSALCAKINRRGCNGPLSSYGSNALEQHEYAGGHTVVTYLLKRSTICSVSKTKLSS